MRRLLLLFSVVLCAACGSSKSPGKKGHRIGIDPSWRPLNFEELQPYVNGYTEEVLIHVAQSSRIQIEKVRANWDTLLDGLHRGEYDALLTSMPPYAFNTARYDFSSDYLLLGPVIVTGIRSKYSELSQLSGELVGVLTGDPAVLLIEKFPEIVIRNFDSIPDALDAVVSGEIEAAVIDRLPAVNYVNDLYSETLRVASEPLTSMGLHLITLKGRDARLLETFNKALARMQKKGKLSDLQRKWNLGAAE
jgi:ABC-type amino acid transport substrate-binding protein